MVFISNEVHSDLEKFRQGLLKWKITLTKENIFNYVSDIESACYSLEKKLFTPMRLMRYTRNMEQRFLLIVEIPIQRGTSY